MDLTKILTVEELFNAEPDATPGKQQIGRPKDRTTCNTRYVASKSPEGSDYLLYARNSLASPRTEGEAQKLQMFLYVFRLKILSGKVRWILGSLDTCYADML